MKFSITIFLILNLVSVLLSSNLKLHREVYDEQEAKFYTRYAKFANCAKNPILINCPQCSDPQDSYKLFFFYEMTRMSQYVYKFLIHYSDSLKTIVLSFAGPDITNHKYIKFLYSAGWSFIKEYRIRIEREYNLIYFNKLRPILVDKLMKLMRSGRVDYKYVFTGHSIGGSLALLSAYDLAKRNIVTLKETKIFTYGMLRIGNNSFAHKLGKTLKHYKIVKRNDIATRIPNCSIQHNTWQCFDKSSLKVSIYKKAFPLKNYMLRYRKGLKSNIRNVYDKYIYRSQPNGLQILYKDDMISYKQCSYVNGRTACEKTFKTPENLSFENTAHNEYFNIEIDKC